MATRYAFLELLAPRITDELVVTSVAGVAREWQHWKHREGNLYTVFLPAATPFAFGLAAALPHRRVLSLDGDGSMLMGPSILPAIANKNPSNLVVIVFDNELYLSASGKRVPTFTAGRTDLAAFARGAGVSNARLVRELPEFEEAVDEAFQASDVSLIAVKVEVSDRPEPVPPLTHTRVENKFRFLRYIEETEKIRIVKPQKV